MFSGARKTTFLTTHHISSIVLDGGSKLIHQLSAWDNKCPLVILPHCQCNKASIKTKTVLCNMYVSYMLT